MAVSAEEWFGLIDAEYLKEFITSGGAAIKFVVGEPDDLATAERRLARLAGAHGLVHIGVDAASFRLHMVQDLFFALARQIDWEAMAQRFVEALFKRQGLDWPSPGAAVGLNAIAEANAIDATVLRGDLQRWLTLELMRDTRMAQDFRVALTWLCRRCTEHAGPENDAHYAPALEWLRGEARRVGPLRKLQISNRIARHNARAMLRSLCRWLRLSGHSGLSVTLDIRQLAKKGSMVAEGSIRYGPAAVMDAYEVLRQLVDDSEQMEGLLLVVLAGEAFVDGDPRRSIDAYTALKMRVWADVHARRRDNPLAPLVTLEEHAGSPPA